jgi:hypothetical protein
MDEQQLHQMIKDAAEHERLRVLERQKAVADRLKPLTAEEWRAANKLVEHAYMAMEARRRYSQLRRRI